MPFLVQLTDNKTVSKRSNPAIHGSYKGRINYDGLGVRLHFRV